MAVPVDMAYLRHCIDLGLISGSVLELGSRHRVEDGGNSEAICRAAGLEWTGSDIEAGAGVDFTLDILDDAAVAAVEPRWDSVLLGNLLEHVYDPVAALGNALSLTARGGTCVVVGPVVWPLHDYPFDFWRPMPDFFLEFARRHDATVPPEGFTWLVDDRLVPVTDLMDGAQKVLPSKVTAARIWGKGRAQRSRLVNAGLNTVARKLHFPYVGLGVAIRRGR